MTVINSQDGNPSNGTTFNVTDAVYNGGPGTKTIHGISLGAGEIVLTIGTHNLQANDTIRIADNSLIFTCTMDNRATEHAYPRATDPASGANLSVSIFSSTQIRVNVGESSSGGFFAPLQMELIASILENSTA